MQHRAGSRRFDIAGVLRMYFLNQGCNLLVNCFKRLESELDLGAQVTRHGQGLRYREGVGLVVYRRPGPPDLRAFQRGQMFC